MFCISLVWCYSWTIFCRNMDATGNCADSVPGILFIHIPLELLSVTLLVCDPCLFCATQQCCPYSSVVMLAVLSVWFLPVGIALDFFAWWKLLSAEGWHATPWYQVYVWTGGLASLQQVRVTGSLSCSSPPGETETAVYRGESRKEGDEKLVEPGCKPKEVHTKHWLLFTYQTNFNPLIKLANFCFCNFINDNWGDWTNKWMT